MRGYTSFVVRIWSDGQSRSHGTIQHVASGDSLSFLDLQAIIPFITSHTTLPSEAARGPGPENLKADGDPANGRRKR
ncbi:MAG: hypothetical protein JXA74_04010 [Anaerolineae bacterium]|nr:hypothetical protein [Anaerolineae bacterium]